MEERVTKARKVLKVEVKRIHLPKVRKAKKVKFDLIFKCLFKITDNIRSFFIQIIFKFNGEILSKKSEIIRITKTT